MSIIDLTVEVIDISNTDDESNDEEEECCICYSKLSSSKTIELPCGHVFHDKCIRTWSKKKKNCPLDRKPFRLSDLSKSGLESKNKRKRSEEEDRDEDEVEQRYLRYLQLMANATDRLRGQIGSRQEELEQELEELISAY